MSQATRKLFAVILLLLLVVVPFIDWKLGAVLWMCAWLVFIFQNLLPGNKWRPPNENNGGDEREE